jgi:hypothetical protein
MPRSNHLSITSIVLLMASSTAAPAQTPVPSQPGKPSERSSPQDPRSTGSTCPGSNLSERLDRCNGVIPPPRGITPDTTIKPPDTGRTPVIPPPGAPGGNPQIEPKLVEMEG